MNLSSGGDGRIVKRRECELEDGRLVHDQRRFLCDCALLSERYNANRTCTKMRRCTEYSEKSRNNYNKEYINK
jgi:hypothetical protein